MKDYRATQLYLHSEKDDLFDKGPWPKPFVFNEAVVRVFDDMIARSVPLYHEVVTCAAHWAKTYYQAETYLVDVGCSTGTFLALLGQFLRQPAKLIGLDNSEAMLEKAREKLAPLQNVHQIDLRCEHVADYAYENSSVVVMNYTLQFLPLAQRQPLMQTIYNGLQSGGLLFLSEKVKSKSPHIQETSTRHYEAFKAHNGYAHPEIARKKEALEQVLVPLTEQQQLQMLHQAGFAQIDSVIKLHNFCSFVALKD